MSKLFVSVNKVGYQNKSRQSSLELEKYWVTQCGWIWLCTTVAMGMIFTNLWKLFFMGLKDITMKN